MNSGGDNESDHSPLILDGDYKTVNEGDENERLPWEFSDGEDDMIASEENMRGVPEEPKMVNGRRINARPETLTKALFSLNSLNTPSSMNVISSATVASSATKRSSPTKATSTSAPVYIRPMTATMADIRFIPKLATSGIKLETESLTTSATTSPHDSKSYDLLRGDSRLGLTGHKRKPSISTMANFQEFSTPLAWNELPRLDDLNLPLRLLTEQETNWSCICIALQDVRRLVLHHSEAVDFIVRKDASMLLVLIPRILELIESPRSLVSKSAMVCLHDIFLFTPTQVPGNLVFDCLHGILRRSTCNSFLAEEAMKCLKQIVISGETIRVLHALMTVLTKQGRNFTTLRNVTLYAAGLFLLRLKAQALNAVLQHREFVPSFLKPIIKATNDASQDCRFAAAECCIILDNLVPDLRFRFRNLGTDVDVASAMNRARRLFKSLADVYDLSTIAANYARCPDHAPIDLSVDRLQTAKTNIEEISSQFGAESPYGVAAPSYRSVTPSGNATLSPASRTKYTMSTNRPAYKPCSNGLGGALPSRGLTPSTRSPSGTDRLGTPPERLYSGGRANCNLLNFGSNREGLAMPFSPGEVKTRDGMLSFEMEGRRRNLVNKRAVEDLGEGQLPAYATRGNLRYGSPTTDESRHRSKLMGNE